MQPGLPCDRPALPVFRRAGRVLGRLLDLRRLAQPLLELPHRLPEISNHLGRRPGPKTTRTSARLPTRLCCRRRLLGNDEVPEQHAPRLGLDRVRVGRQQVIAEEALLVVSDHVGFENVLPALHEGPRPSGSMVGADWRAGQRDRAAVAP